MKWVDLTDMLVSKDTNCVYSIYKPYRYEIDWKVVDRETRKVLSEGRCNSITKAKARITEFRKILKDI